MDLILLAAKKVKELGPQAPEWFQLYPYGRVVIEGEPPAYMDDEGAALILAQFNDRTNDMVIDYEHQTLTGQKAPAAGWIKDMQWRGSDGLWLKVDWTDEAANYIKNKEYRYFSPVCFARKSDRKIVSLYNVALTNQPRIQNLQALVAKQKPEQNERSHTMWDKLKKLLGLADDAGEEQAFEAVEQVVAKSQALEKKVGDTEIVACKAVLGELALSDGATEAEVLKAIDSLKAPATAAQELSKQVAVLTAEIAKMKQDDLVTLALKDGKTSPEELDAWGRNLALKNPEQFTAIVMARPAGSVVPVDALQKGPKDKLELVNEATLLVGKMMGVTEEDIKKYGH